MTISSIDVTSGPYSGDGITSTFTYDFPIESKSELVVYQTDDSDVLSALLVDSDYTVNSVGDPDGGTITLTAGALPSGYSLFIRSNRTALQSTDFDSQGGFFPDVHEDAFDKLTVLHQQLSDVAFRSPANVVRTAAQNTIPEPEAGKALVWGVGGVLTNATAGAGDSGLRTDLATDALDQGAALVANSVQVVSNIATLRLIAPNTSRRIRTMCHTVAGKGGGLWYAVTGAAIGTYVDNNGTIVLPAGGDGSSAWQLLHDGKVTDAQFGVIRDNATDSGPELAAFISAQKAEGWEGIFTSGIAISEDTELSISTANARFRGPGVNLSTIKIGATFTPGNTLLTVTDCGRTAGTGIGEQSWQTTLEKRCVLTGFSLHGRVRSVRAHGLEFNGLNDEAEIDLGVYDFRGHGVAIGAASSASVMRESRISLRVRNCGDNRDGNDYAAVHIGGLDDADGHNNLWFDLLRIVYPRGIGLRVLPAYLTNTVRKLFIKHLFLHGSAQLPAPPFTDSNGEEWHNTCNLMEVGNPAPAAATEVATVDIEYFNGVGVETGYRYCYVVGGSAVHVAAFNMTGADATAYAFEFDGAQTSSIRNFRRIVNQQPSTANALPYLLKITSMEGPQHKVSISGLGSGTTIPIGQPGYVGALSDLQDDDLLTGQIYKPQDTSATWVFPSITFFRARKALYLQRFTIIPNSALTADDTNYATIRITLVSAAGGFGATLASVTTQTSGSGGSGNWAAGDWVDIPLAASRILQDEGLAVVITKTGSGVIVPHCGIIAELSPNLSVI